MRTAKKLTLATLLALAAASVGLAAADRAPPGPPTVEARHPDSVDRRQAASWVVLGDVGTHRHDADDFVPVKPAGRYQRLQLRARGGPVALAGVKIQYADGRTQRVDAHRRLRPGEAVVIDVPYPDAPIKMVVLAYGNAGPFWRALETAHVQVFGLPTLRFDDGPVHRDRRGVGGRFEVQGGVRVRIR